MSSHILMNFGLGGSPTAYMDIAPGKKTSWDSDLYKSHLGKELRGDTGWGNWNWGHARCV